jgi:hypothetical protein
MLICFYRLSKWNKHCEQPSNILAREISAFRLKPLKGAWLVIDELKPSGKIVVKCYSVSELGITDFASNDSISLGTAKSK